MVPEVTPFFFLEMIFLGDYTKFIIQTEIDITIKAKQNHNTKHIVHVLYNLKKKKKKKKVIKVSNMYMYISSYSMT